MTRWRSAKFALVALAGITMSACSSQAQDISGAWSATDVGGKPVRGVSISIEDARLSGTGGCNRIAGPAVISGGDVKFGPLIATRMFCDGKMETEEAFIAPLEAAKSFDLSEGTLTLKDASGAAVAVLVR
ncbi:MAG: META domain-containing protein [Hyphomicrobium sp.]